jgi:hypothetical protein
MCQIVRCRVAEVRNIERNLSAIVFLFITIEILTAANVVMQFGRHVSEELNLYFFRVEESANQVTSKQLAAIC